MEIKVKFEQGYFNLYNTENSIIGKVKIEEDAAFKESELIIEDKQFNVLRDDWNTKVLRNGNLLFQIKTNSFSGNAKIIELNKKLKGVWGTNWASQLVDENGNTELKIRNEKKLVDNGNYTILLENDDLETLQILISLYFHLYVSSLKEKSNLIGVISGSQG